MVRNLKIYDFFIKVVTNLCEMLSDSPSAASTDEQYPREKLIIYAFQASTNLYEKFSLRKIPNKFLTRESF